MYSQRGWGPCFVMETIDMNHYHGEMIKYLVFHSKFKLGTIQRRNNPPGSQLVRLQVIMCYADHPAGRAY